MRFIASILLVGMMTGCSAGAADDTGNAESAATSNELVGSWSIETQGKLPIPAQRFRTVATLILRPSGTYDALVAPREAGASRFIDDRHTEGMRDGLEVIGYPQGLSGKWSIRTNGGEKELVLSRAGTAIILKYRRDGDTLSLTNNSYAGTQDGKTDVLHATSDDCRIADFEKTSSEKEADALYEEYLGLGQSPYLPLANTVQSLEGYDELEKQVNGGPRCTKPLHESVLRGTWRDKKTNDLRALKLTFSDSRGDWSQANSQIYVYDASHHLRVVVTTTESRRPASVDLRSNEPTHVVEQHRTYFDDRGMVTRETHQPLLQQASLETQKLLLAGRRFTTVHDPLSVIDMPSCTTAVSERVELVASDPRDPEASLRAPARCEE